MKYNVHMIIEASIRIPDIGWLLTLLAMLITGRVDNL